LFKFLNSTPARIVTVLLLLQTAVLYSSIRPEFVPASLSLAQVPQNFGPWTMMQESFIDKETEDVLKADDILNRVYKNGSTGAGAYLFVASFRTQRNGKAPHSPKNCLPGSGWTQESAETATIDIGLGAPIVVNRYIVVLGQERDLVLYWYQSRDRVVADEFKAKFWVVADAIRLNRTDSALVRVVVPIQDKNEDLAMRTGTDFISAFFGTLRQYLPS
jgi:EpsI family protein